MDINHLEIVDDFCVRVYFDSFRCWYLYSPTYPLLGPTMTLRNMLCTSRSIAFTGADLMQVGSNPTYFEYEFTTDCIVQVTNATKNGVPMTEGIDFYIRAGYDTFKRNVFVNRTLIAPTDTIVINYCYATPNGAGGTYLGGNLGYDWTDTMYAYGYYYPVSVTTTKAVLKKNQYFFLETPILGEIDWRWYWNGTTQPRSGYYKIDILDVVKCTNSYCTRGDGTYNPLYMPAADVDSSDLCHIGILDVVTIVSKYGQTFGTPP
jgi:hypothetical protein